MVDCWSCGAEAGDALGCPGCGALQPPSGRADFFTVLGVPAKMALDVRALDQAFREASRRVHPDRYAQASAIERRLAAEHTTRVNEAHRTLKDPLRRGEYLMKLAGVDVTAEAHRTDDKALLFEMLELQEQVERGGPAALEALGGALRSREAAALGRVAQWFDAHAGTREACVNALNELRYLRRLSERIDAKLDEG